MNAKSDLLRQFARMSRPLHLETEAAIAAILSQTDITVRMHAVLAVLNEIGPASVPEVARKLLVQRQYVQVMMNEVAAAHLVTRLPNPVHKRSVLFELSAAGRSIVEQIEQAERAVVHTLARSFTYDEVEKAHHVAEAVLDGYRKLNSELSD